MYTSLPHNGFAFMISFPDADLNSYRENDGKQDSEYAFKERAKGQEQ